MDFEDCEGLVEDERVPDKYFLEAQKEIKQLFEDDKEAVYYVRQLQVRLEDKYFHWITHHATNLLVPMYLKEERINKPDGTSRRFLIRKTNRYSRRKINESEKIMDEYSQSKITKSCGARAEDLFIKALAFKGFNPIAENVNEFNGKKWTKTEHDLDVIFTRDEISYGCEIKNTLPYIPKGELEIKLEMCRYLELRPLFIMRFAPKTYMKEIIDNGGFGLIFKKQIYELSQKELVIKMDEVLGLPVACPRAIEDGIIRRFENWHRKQVNIK